ncbi:unnamed protein product [Staurois parvus]|uniref:Uncharacterized protein n=1 Tax=Staurois parvus TaxID=386267 RepID=A0ABN9CS13_9NEOB|nr:unnamed protein product [Staurois parvus]
MYNLFISGTYIVPTLFQCTPEGGIVPPSLVSVGGIVPHHWCQWGGNSAPSLVSVGGIVPHHWCHGGWNSAPSLVSVGGGE